MTIQQVGKGIGTAVRYGIFYVVAGYLPLQLGGFVDGFFDSNDPLVLQLALLAFACWLVAAMILLGAAVGLIAMAHNRIYPGLLKTLADGIREPLTSK